MYETTEDGRFMTSFYYCSLKHQWWFTEQHIFKIILYCFINSKCAKIISFHLVLHNIWWFHRSRDFEAMKEGKLTIWSWLSCPYNKRRLVDLTSPCMKLFLNDEKINIGCYMMVRVDKPLCSLDSKNQFFWIPLSKSCNKKIFCWCFRIFVFKHLSKHSQ